MAATFQSLRDTRLPKATHAVGLLQNLVRYAHDEQEAKDVVNAISDAADDLDAVFAKKWGWADEPAPATPSPATPSPATPAPTTPTASRIDGDKFPAGSARDDVRWALDAVTYNPQLARDLLRRALKG